MHNGNKPWRLAEVMLVLYLSILSATSAEILTKNSSAGGFTFDLYFLVPLRVHLLSAPDKPRLTTTLTSMDVGRILEKVNRVWAQAGIQFYLDSVVKETATNASLHSEKRGRIEFDWMLQLRPPATQGGQVVHIYYVKAMAVNGICLDEAIFVKDEAVLTAVPGGINEPLPRVMAHELAHRLTLEHRQNRTNLMASSTTGILLNDAEIQQVRAAASLLPGSESATVILKKADELHEAGRLTEARIWYERLARLSINAPEVRMARERLKFHPSLRAGHLLSAFFKNSNGK